MARTPVAPRVIETMREVPRTPTCCDRPMRRMQAPGALGEVRTAWMCAKECGNQIMDPLPVKPKAEAVVK